ncbi:MAG: hypothetical protein FD130_900 [Halothiobacillaceae bacterium]|nr:MAG: hypothetical protein FD130_900 [Halothiobacillaceae bacterium]
MVQGSCRLLLRVLLVVLCLAPLASLSFTAHGADTADTASPDHNTTTLMGKFTEGEESTQSTVKDEVKHKILFIMGIALLVLIISTAAVGINMALFGKELFVAHMVLAGATVFLSLAHAVTAIVWFFPF